MSCQRCCITKEYVTKVHSGCWSQYHLAGLLLNGWIWFQGIFWNLSHGGQLFCFDNVLFVFLLSSIHGALERVNSKKMLLVIFFVITKCQFLLHTISCLRCKYVLLRGPHVAFLEKWMQLFQLNHLFNMCNGQWLSTRNWSSTCHNVGAYCLTKTVK